MAAKYWIKLYHEILNDPKMGRLDDSAWRLAIECFLMAGEVDQDGLLGTTEDIAWKLRRPCNESLHDLLRKLNACNILVLRDDNTWFVKNFAKRQDKVEVAERVRQYRKRQAQKGNSSASSTKKGMATRNENVTKSYIDTDTDTDREERQKPPPAKTKVHRVDIAPPSPSTPNGKGNLPQVDVESLATAIADLCKIDRTLASNGKLQKIRAATVKLFAKQAGADDIKDFGHWWLSFDWRGQKGSPPTPDQICDEWERFRGAKLNGSQMRKLDDAKLEAYKRMEKERMEAEG